MPAYLVLSQVVSLDPEDASALAELVLALTHVNVKLAEQVGTLVPDTLVAPLDNLQQYADSLPAVQMADGSDLNVDELEAAATLRVSKVGYMCCNVQGWVCSRMAWAV